MAKANSGQIKLLCVATAKDSRAILQTLVERAGDELDLSYLISGKTGDLYGTSITRMNQRKGTRSGKHFMAGRRFEGAARALIQSEDFDFCLEEWVDQMHRRGPHNAYKHHRLKTVQEYFDFYHVLADVMAQEIQERGITHGLFFNVPHLSYDTLAYQVLKAMGIPTVIVTQSQFPNKFWSMPDVASLGHISDRTNLNAKPLELERPDSEQIFYMKNIKQEREEGGKPGLRAFASFLLYLFFHQPIKALNPVYTIGLWRQIRRAYAKFPKWRDPFAKFFHEDKLAYLNHIAEFEDQSFDLESEFVYVPLQLQPEMTTSSLGGWYRDQALMIEQIAQLVPDHVKIYVKENPKQGTYMRNPMFFHRLNRIPNVVFLPSYANSNALTQASKFVATVTGTVGWEAVRFGKPVLVFGKPWYASLPGVIVFSEDLNYEDIVSTKWEQDTLSQQAGNLFARAHEGCVDRHYTQLVKGYDFDANKITVADTLLKLLKKETTFSFEKAEAAHTPAPK